MHGLAGSAESKTGRAEINNGGTDRGGGGGEGRGEAEGADSTEGPLAWLANDASAALLFLLGRFSLTLLSTFSTLVSEATVLIAGVKKLV